MLGSSGRPRASNPNLIINGDHLVNQYNDGTQISAPAGNGFICDRWIAQTSLAGKFATAIVDAQPNLPVIKYLYAVSLSAYPVPVGEYYLISQKVEGINLGQLKWGTAFAQPVTLSFYASCVQSLGPFGGVISNSAQDRQYPFLFSLNQLNTWEKKIITIPGDQAGAWLTGGGTVGAHVRWSMGAGAAYQGPPGAWIGGGPYFGAVGQSNVVSTAGVQWALAAVKLEVGGMATPFQPDDVTSAIARCQRYAFRIGRNAGQRFGITGFATDVTGSLYGVNFPVSMCKAPTFRSAGGFDVIGPGSAGTGVTVLGGGTASLTEMLVQASYNASFVAGQGTNLSANTNGSYLFFDAEL